MQTTNSKKGFAVLGMLFGVALVVVGIIMIFGSGGIFKSSGYVSPISTYLNSSTYFGVGNTFYTYEYQATLAAYEAAESTYFNVSKLGYAINTFSLYFGLVVAIVGGIVFCYFGCKLGDANSAAAPSYNSAAGLSYSSRASAPKQAQSSSGGTWVCSCGTRNPNINKFCNGCGKTRGASGAPPMPSDIWRCSRCTAKNPRSAHKCQNCGKEREEQYFFKKFILKSKSTFLTSFGA